MTNSSNDSLSRIKQNTIPKHTIHLIIEWFVLLSALSGIIIGRGWALLFAFVINACVSMPCEWVKRLYWRGFDPVLSWASRRRKFGIYFLFYFLTWFLDFTLTAVSVLAVAAYVWLVADGSAVSATTRWLALLTVFNLPIPYTTKNRMTFRKSTSVWNCIFAEIAMVILSFFMTTSLATIALALAVLTPVSVLEDVCFDWAEMMHKYRDGYQIGNYSKDILVSAFEPDSFVIVRGNWCGFTLSLLLLVGGVIGAVFCGHYWKLLFVPLFMAFGWVGRVLMCEIDRTAQLGSVVRERACFTMMMLFPVCLTAVYFGRGSLIAQLSLAAAFLGGLYFFIGFIVSKKSTEVNDTLDLMTGIAAITATVLLRMAGCVWWESVLPIFGLAFIQPYIRAYFPRHDLPPAREYPPSNIHTAPATGINWSSMRPPSPIAPAQTSPSHPFRRRSRKRNPGHRRH